MVYFIELSNYQPSAVTVFYRDRQALSVTSDVISNDSPMLLVDILRPKENKRYHDHHALFTIRRDILSALAPAAGLHLRLARAQYIWAAVPALDTAFIECSLVERKPTAC